jgi:hypothetical protein
MNKKVFLLKASGGFGNQLLNYIDAVQKYPECDFITRNNELRLIQRNPATSFSLFSKKEKWQLSEVLFDKKKIKLDKVFWISDQKKRKKTVAFHFRGGDFFQWKKHSIIPAIFFIDNIKLYKGCFIELYTDDRGHPIYREIVNFCHSNKIQYREVNGNTFHDFLSLTTANTIIASPSTFSLTAAVLGSGRIVFPHNYAMIEKETSGFWRSVAQGDKSEFVNISLL